MSDVLMVIVHAARQAVKAYFEPLACGLTAITSPRRTDCRFGRSCGCRVIAIATGRYFAVKTLSARKNRKFTHGRESQHPRAFIRSPTVLALPEARRGFLKGADMSSEYRLVLSGELDRELEMVVQEEQTGKADVLRKALALYLVARKGHRRGMKLALVDPASDRLVQEIIGL
jgi:hypothetical protein